MEESKLDRKRAENYGHPSITSVNDGWWKGPLESPPRYIERSKRDDMMIILIETKSH